MGQAVEKTAVAECIRATIDLFMADHPDLDGVADVEVDQETRADGAFGVTVNGFQFDVVVREPEHA